ncbi:membrane protein [Agaricicola taiwanensis]|uniref:Membrane protein n=1 Tax=Agaricicola taiwanensis TaxID=591372 RepID=A0A8J2YIW1_9RHOB|nr:YdcF family protein [Agaricicola taiwanensis]GGE46605.1 membrane protein [Agaricicola taiwanensis]
MFFALSKVLGFFALPSNLMISIGLVGALALFAGWVRLGGALLVISVLTLAVLGLSPLGNILLLVLEDRFPKPAENDNRPVAGIVVLGGSFDTIVAGARGEVALNESAERLTVIAELAKRYPEARIVFSGGQGTLFYSGATEAQVAARMFESFGIAPERITLEDRSRNTRENAVFSRDLVNPGAGERWLLVTSAYHMPRSVGCFRAAGFPVDAFPVDYRTRGYEDMTRPFRSVGEGLRRVDIAVREWVGLFVYRITGYTDALVPAPL